MSEASETNMVCIGAVCLLAEQLSHDGPTGFVINPDPFQLRLFASQRILTRLGEDAIKEIGFMFIGSSEWAARIIAMQDGDKALLPSQQGCYCVVQRFAAEAALGIVDFLPQYSLDWSEGSEAQE
jgi:hypothetical protein